MSQQQESWKTDLPTKDRLTRPWLYECLSKICQSYFLSNSHDILFSHSRKVRWPFKARISQYCLCPVLSLCMYLLRIQSVLSNFYTELGLNCSSEIRKAAPITLLHVLCYLDSLGALLLLAIFDNGVSRCVLAPKALSLIGRYEPSGKRHMKPWNLFLAKPIQHVFLLMHARHKYLLKTCQAYTVG